MEKDDKRKKCLFPECGREVVSRGLCHRHYMVAKWAVSTNKTTWSKLEAIKKAIPLKGPAYDMARKWFLEK